MKDANVNSLTKWHSDFPVVKDTRRRRSNDVHSPWTLTFLTPLSWPSNDSLLDLNSLNKIHDWNIYVANFSSQNDMRIKYSLVAKSLSFISLSFSHYSIFLFLSLIYLSLSHYSIFLSLVFPCHETSHHQTRSNHVKIMMAYRWSEKKKNDWRSEGRYGGRYNDGEGQKWEKDKEIKRERERETWLTDQNWFLPSLIPHYP